MSPVAAPDSVSNTNQPKFAKDPDHPGPQPPGSLIKVNPPLNTEQLAINLDVQALLTDDDKQAIPYLVKARRAANYLAVAMIYLKDNVDIRQPLKQEHVKDRLLGHWGTCPAITFVYTHANHLIKKNDVDMLLVVGPGHGAPAVLANLYLENSIGHFDKKYNWSREGLRQLIRGFSWPGGFPSHVNAETPGAIHEGGELGYALAVSFGAVMDNPDLIVTCIVGDGEAESGPTATAWHSYKYIDPKESGAVIPVLNLNGYKISESTVFGNMSNEELLALFSGYGYQVRFVSNMDQIDEEMAVTMQWYCSSLLPTFTLPSNPNPFPQTRAYNQIRHIQSQARTSTPIAKPRWPMIILRTPKGWTGPAEAHGKQIVGTWRAHQVPLQKVTKDEEDWKLFVEWLESYKVHELIDEDGRPGEDVLRTIPKEGRLLGRNPLANGRVLALNRPSVDEFAVKKSTKEWQSCMQSVGKYLAKVVEQNKDRFRIFSPDEMESNKLSDIFKVTSRNFQWDPFTTSGGRVIEVLSEHQCQGWMQGYTLTGRTALFPSYESFLGIITTMMIQYSKFLKVAREVPWRGDVPSINYIESSTLWRQEHNGFSHQNPGFIDSIINLKSKMVRVYLPPDANTAISTVDHCLGSKNYVNLVISSKQPMPVFLSMEEAKEHCKLGASIWRWASSHNGENPDVVIVGCGAEVTFEAVAAAMLLRRDAPELRVRVVNVTDLMILSPTLQHPHALSVDKFNELFTADKPIVFNFHGYPDVVRGLTFERPTVPGRMIVHGYNEEGTTTTPFRMLTYNKCSRFDLIIDALKLVESKAPRADLRIDTAGLIKKYEDKLKWHTEYIVEHGSDPDEVVGLGDGEGGHGGVLFESA
ncbi:hypothetical protein HK097_008030 [Rhizophlyctis rosea]|uniref:Phosphoketolase n=1 Tax=Rhizophlyctis rosea TaxID=64517 RepID=A0AAD5SCD4_9FUNG|nr:hypothetical protein HK097_008030 [Rhizophlyctis rosea]